MDIDDFLNQILEIKDTSLATVSLTGTPSNRIIDMMYAEEHCLFFLTAKGKNLYKELKNNFHISLAVCKNKIGYSLQGKAIETDTSHYLPLLFENNPFMNEIYPAETKKALVVFKITAWSGKYFDLNQRPIERHSFFYQAEEKQKGYFIHAEKCTSCGKCLKNCPQGCIDIREKKVLQNHCLHCGNCFETCDFHAIEVRK